MAYYTLCLGVGFIYVLVSFVFQKKMFSEGLQKVL